jgi:hypothetical protein
MLMRQTSFKGFSIIKIVRIHRTMVFWTKLSCWCKIYSTKTTVHLCWSHSVTLGFFLLNIPVTERNNQQSIKFIYFNKITKMT